LPAHCSAPCPSGNQRLISSPAISSPTRAPRWRNTTLLLSAFPASSGFSTCNSFIADSCPCIGTRQRPEFPAGFAIELSQLLRRGFQVPAFERAPRVNRFTSSPERPVPDSIYFCAPVGIDPMLEHDGHESIRRPGLSSDMHDEIQGRRAS